MTNVDRDLTELDALANAAAAVMSRDSETAITKFGEAHALAVKIGDMDKASKLSLLIARSWSLRKTSLATVLRFARRGAKEAEALSRSSASSTLGHFYEIAAARTSVPEKSRRAVVFWKAASNAYARAATQGGEPIYKTLADRCQEKVASRSSR